jgi:flagellar biosynthesis chaperone FliJ
MKRFHFRPAAVLELSRQRHDAAQGQLARAQQERDKATRLRDEAVNAASRAEDDMTQRLLAGADVETVIRHRNWIAHQRAEAEGRGRAHAARQVEVERATADVRRTRRQMRALERLRDRMWRLHLKEADRHEAVEMDRLALSRFTRAKSGGSECDNH